MCVAGSYIFELRLAPDSKTLPLGNRFWRGYNGTPLNMVPPSVHCVPFHICTVVLTLEFVSFNPESTSTEPLPSTVPVGYQRPPFIFCRFTNFSVAGSKAAVSS